MDQDQHDILYDEKPGNPNGLTLHEAVQPEEMPREKLKKYGAKALSDVELIAIMLRTGVHGLNVMEVARALHKAYRGNLVKMGDASLDEIQNCVKGIGEAKAIAFLAALELGRRRQLHQVKDSPLTSSQAAYEFFAAEMGMNCVEEFHVAVLDNGCNVIHSEMITRGGLASTVVDIRIVLSAVIRWGGTRFMIAHNHPAGNASPSQSDIDLTSRISCGAQTLGLTLLDHIIVVQGRGDCFYSFHDNGKL